MPRQQVYGKRSRVVYDLTAFSSPEQSCPQPTEPEKTIKVHPVDVSSKLKEMKMERSGRTALGERNNNAVVLPVEALQDAEKKRRRKPKEKKREKRMYEEEILVRSVIDDVVGKEERRAVPVEVESTTRRSPRKPIRTTKEDIPQPQSESQPEPKQPNFEPVMNSLERKMGQLQVQQEPISNEPNRPQPDLASTYEHHCADLLNLSPQPLTCFNTWSEQLSEHFSVTKIAEASFGEVYRLSLREHLPDFSSTDESVFKIIPLQQPEITLPVDKRKRKAAMTKTEGMSKPEDVATEVKVLHRMSAIPGFTNFRDVRVLQGRPAEAFAKAFKAWNAGQKAKKKELSHFPDPSKKSSYAEDQLWAVIEMQDAGTDLERLVENRDCTAIWTVWDVFWQVVLSLAKGEEGAEFEHRDLHLGNICVRSPSDTSGEVNVKKKLGFTSLETTIIDYTISRCIMPDTTVAYQDLSRDSTLFEGNSSEEYQYDIYRYMRGALFLDEALADVHARSDEVESSGRLWKQYHPQTNLVWLHLVLYKLLEQVDWPSAKRAPAKKKAEEWEKWKRANDLEHVLLEVQDLLDPGQICGNGIRSSSDLVVLALGEGWIDVEDVVGHGVGDDSALVSQLEGLEL